MFERRQRGRVEHGQDARATNATRWREKERRSALTEAAPISRRRETKRIDGGGVARRFAKHATKTPAHGPGSQHNRPKSWPGNELAGFVVSPV
jgi:hypothetical protein